MNNSSQNTLIVFGSLTGLAFILVGGVIALVYSDGASATIVLPLLLSQIGPLIVMLMSLAKGIENGAKADTTITQTSQIPMTTAQLVQNTTPPPATPPTIINVAPPAQGGGSSGT